MHCRVETADMSFKPYAMYECAPTEEVLYRLRVIDLWAHTSLKTVPKHFDPIFTPIFTSAFASIGFSAGTAGILGGVATGIATSALSVGLNMLLAPKPPTPEDGKIPLKQGIPPRQWVVGRTRVGGAFMLWDVKGRSLCAVQAIAGHPVHAVIARWLHDDKIQVNGGDDQFGTVDGIYGGRYGNDVVTVDYRLGSESPMTAYGFIVDVFAGDTPEPIWTSQHKGIGQASLALKADFVKATSQAERFPYGPPQQSALVDGAHVWDPRDGDQDPDDPSTWGFERNAALILLWHLCFNEFGMRRDYRKAILPVRDLWEEEADICDENVEMAAGGTQKRYWCDGFDRTDHDPKVGVNAILSTCDGHLVQRGDGALILTVGKFRESRCATLTDADVIGHQLQYGVLPEDECNRLIPKFTYPDTDYTTSDTDYFEDTDAQLIAGRVLAQDGDYSWCTQWQQARRLGIRDWRRLRQKIRGSLDVRLSGINAVYSRWVRLDTPVRMLRLDGKVIENRHSILAVTKGGFSMDFIKHPDNIDDWDPETDEGEQPPVPPRPNTINLSPPVFNSYSVRVVGGVTRLRLKLIDPDDNSLGLVIRYRTVDDGDGNPGDWEQKTFDNPTVSGGYVTVVVSGVPENEDLDVEARWELYANHFSEWSPPYSVTTTP